MKKTLLLLLLFVMGCAGSSMPFNSNYNWNKSHYEQHDGVVAITVDKKQAYCSGVVLNPDLIMTAGHCANPLLHGRLYITHGCDDITMEGCTHTLALIAIPHPNHKKSDPVWNDIGIIKPIESITDVKPVTLANSIETGSIIRLAGFGRRVGENGGILYAGKSKINHFWLYGFETYLNGVNGPCAGDSGSPAFDTEGNVIGILSRSTSDERTNCGGIAKYTIPIVYMDWLEEMNRLDVIQWKDQKN